MGFSLISAFRMSKSAFVFYVFLSSSLAQKQGIETSENFPENYPINLDKNYTIEADDIFAIEFSNFEVENHSSCSYDWVMIVDGDGSVLMPKKCGSEIPAPVTTNTNTAVVIFHSDYSVNKPGFRLQWKTVASVKSGLVISGGFGSTLTTELFNPITGKTCSLKDLPGHRASHSMDRLEDGTLIVCGGRELDERKTCVKYEGTAPYGKWTNFSTLVNRYGHSSYVSKGEILLLGGTPGVSTTEIVGGGEQYSLQQRISQACEITDGPSIILTGGYNSGGYLRTVTRYNMKGFVEKLPSLITARRNHGCGCFTNDENKKVFIVAGGYRGTHGFSSSTELLYDTASAWVLGRNLPHGLDRSASVSFDHSVILFGGFTGKEVSDKILSFNSSEAWVQIGNMKNKRI